MSSPSTTPEANAIRQKLWRDRHKHEIEYKEKKRRESRERFLKVRDTEHFRNLNSERMARYRKDPQKGPRLLEINILWIERNPEKDKAQKKARAALKYGKLIRPESCERCGVVPGRGRDGRSLIHGHHQDYSKPLEVKWLCALCHGNERRMA